MYIDKTRLIESVMGTNNKALLYTLPRRFGKSTVLSMIEYSFFYILLLNIEYNQQLL
jgi:hypothetical protein